MAAPTLLDIRSIEWAKSFYWDLYFPSNQEWLDATASDVPVNSDVPIPEAATDATGMEAPPEPPIMFSKWFPASNITEPVFNVTTTQISTPLFSFQIPKAVTYADMSISFYETMQHEVREWLYEWVLYMFGISYQKDQSIQGKIIPSVGALGVRPLRECIRPVIIHKYNSDHSISVKREYNVFPSGTLALQLSSQSSPVEESCTFSVVGGMFTRSSVEPYGRIVT